MEWWYYSLLCSLLNCNIWVTIIVISSQAKMSKLWRSLSSLKNSSLAKVMRKVCVSAACLCVCMYVCPSIHPSIHPSAHPSTIIPSVHFFSHTLFFTQRSLIPKAKCLLSDIQVSNKGSSRQLSQKDRSLTKVLCKKVFYACAPPRHT